MDEVALDERLPPRLLKSKSNSREEDEPESKNNEDELPWCVLCNDDAKFRCLDCDGDLYCNSCNIEAHKNWGDTDHRVVPYKPRSNN